MPKERGKDRSVDVYREVSLRIVDGRIRSGDRIIEERLAEEIQVSRTPIRETLTTLMAEGQVTRTRSGWELVEYSLEELEHAYEVRGQLEALAAFRAAAYGSATAHGRIQRAQADMDEAAATFAADEDQGHVRVAQSMAQLNTVFHDAIAQASENSRLPRVLRVVVVRPLVFSAFAWYSAEELQQSNELHRGISNAIAERDARRAERLMAEHIAQGFDVVRRHLQDTMFEDGDRLEATAAWDRLQANRLTVDGGGPRAAASVSTRS